MIKKYDLTIISNPERSKILKVLWMLVLCASFFGLGFYVNECYIKLRQTPEILVNEKLINSRNIPFPAITICSPLIIKSEFLNMSKFREEFKERKHGDDENLAIMASSAQVCLGEILYLGNKLKNESLNENVFKNLNDYSPRIDDTFKECKISGYDGCKRLFIRSLTEMGICFTFNMLGYHSIFRGNISNDFYIYKRKNITKVWKDDAKIEYYDDKNNPEPPKWSLEDGYSNDDNFIQPLRATGMQFLQMIAKLKNDEISSTCENRYNTYRVVFHLPNEVPTRIHPHTYHEIDHFKYMRISADIKKLDKSIYNFSLQQRGCYLRRERQLRFFKSYTKFNCENECMANFTLKQCGCVKYSMPRSDDMKICQYNSIACWRSVTFGWPNNYYMDERNKKIFPDFPCNCLPSCMQINYRLINEPTCKNSYMTKSR